jgi:hypothetical protein
LYVLQIATIRVLLVFDCVLLLAFGTQGFEMMMYVRCSKRSTLSVVGWSNPPQSLFRRSDLMTGEFYLPA